MKMRWIGMLALGVLCAYSPFSLAQTAQITGIAHVAYRVSDLDKELAFLQKLGYQQSFAFTANGKTTEVFVKVNDRQFIEVYPQTNPSQPLGWMHVCYESDDINALVATLTARGLNPRPGSERQGPATLSLRSGIPTAGPPSSRSTCPARATPWIRECISASIASPTCCSGFSLPVAGWTPRKAVLQESWIQRCGFEGGLPGYCSRGRRSPHRDSRGRRGRSAANTFPR